MNLDIGDYDRGEFVEKLLIQAPANAQGTFYYNGVALTTVTQGGKTWYQVPPAAMQAVVGTNDKFELKGVTFVPDHDYSSYNDGGKPLRFPVQLQVGVTEGASPGADRQPGYHCAGHCRQAALGWGKHQPALQHQ